MIFAGLIFLVLGAALTLSLWTPERSEFWPPKPITWCPSRNVAEACMAAAEERGVQIAAETPADCGHEWTRDDIEAFFAAGAEQIVEEGAP